MVVQHYNRYKTWFTENIWWRIFIKLRRVFSYSAVVRPSREHLALSRQGEITRVETRHGVCRKNRNGGTPGRPPRRHPGAIYEIPTDKLFSKWICFLFVLKQTRLQCLYLKDKHLKNLNHSTIFIVCMFLSIFWQFYSLGLLFFVIWYNVMNGMGCWFGVVLLVRY